MDLLYFLRTRLRFIQCLYDSTVSSFDETKRKIRDGEEPYVDRRDPEGGGEPAFMAEWQEADDSIMVLGHWCLCMVQAALQSYLRDCVSRLGSIWWDSQKLREALSGKQGRSWFRRYQSLFLEELRIDWEGGPVAMSDLEQLNLTRNDLIHNVDVFSFNVERGDSHAERFPRALFTDDMWADAGMGRIRVTRENLRRAVNMVIEFCGWIDRFRCDYSYYQRYLRGCAGRTTGADVDL